MKLHTEEQYSSAKEKDLLPLKCDYCEKHYCRVKTSIRGAAWRRSKHNFCSLQCNGLFKQRRICIKCSHCGEDFIRDIWHVEHSESGKLFCSHSCSTSYYNVHKSKGYSRSKVEYWIEEQLTKLYPNIDILYNDKTMLSPLELDIYVPSFKLAFELNGIFHYEPIFGVDKLKYIQGNDSKKFYLCQKKGINLCVIDTSGMKYFKSDKAQKYVDIIRNIIDSFCD